MTLRRILPLLLVPMLVFADDKKPDDKKPDDKKPDEGIVVIDAKGKENKIKGWEIVAGTRRLGWLAPPLEKNPDDKTDEKKDDKKDSAAPPIKKPVRPPAPRGPEALSFRDENSTNWADGILTLVPLEHVRLLDYDNEKEKVTLKIAAAKPEDDVTLTGETKYRGTNKLTIEAEVDKGELGIASVKFLGGVKTGIKGVRFPAPKAADAPKGRNAEVTVHADRDKKSTIKVVDLQALYLTGQGEKASSILMFKKTIRLDVTKTKKLVVGDEKTKEWTVTLKDGTEETLTLIDQGELDGKEAHLTALIGKVQGGWKLFPLHTVAEITFEDAK